MFSEQCPWAATYRGQPLKGLDRILAHFEDGYAAWVWLTTPRSGLEGATPLSLLRHGEIERATAAAAGDAQGDFARAAATIWNAFTGGFARCALSGCSA